jgi:predicted transcriptional regulator
MQLEDNTYTSQAEIDALSIWDKMKVFRVTNKHRKKCCIVSLEDRIEDLQKLNISVQSTIIEARIQHWQEVLNYIKKR